MIIKLLEAQINFLESLQLKTALNVQQLIKRALSRQEFSDFYALDLLSPYFSGSTPLPPGLTTSKKIHDLLLRRNELVWKIANYYAQGMRKAIIGEVRTYAFDWPTKEADKNALEAVGIDRLSTLKSKDRNLTPTQMIALFDHLDWNSAYGGKPWSNIAQLFKELMEQIGFLKGYVGDHQVVRWHMEGEFKTRLSALVILIDRIHQAEHNTGSLFTHFSGTDMSSWIEEALNEKAIPGSIQKLREHSSPDIADTLKEVYPTPDVEEDELASQIIEVKMSRFSRKKLQNLETRYKDDIAALDLEKGKGWITESQFANGVKETQKQYEADKLKWGPDSPLILNNMIQTYRIKPSDALRYTIRNNDTDSTTSLIDNVDGEALWKLDPKVFKRLSNMGDNIKSRLADKLCRSSREMMLSGDANKQTIELVSNMFEHLSTKELGPLMRNLLNSSVINLVHFLRASGYSTTNLDNAIKLNKQNGEYWDTKVPEQLKMFSFKRTSRLLKLASL